ncbi:MAG: hypothetical protein MZW92_52975 [Comamonadaceae bacterium]|nr:hypothetical protein [Comamonadaceae bacterium]
MSLTLDLLLAASPAVERLACAGGAGAGAGRRVLHRLRAADDARLGAARGAGHRARRGRHRRRAHRRAAARRPGCAGAAPRREGTIDEDDWRSRRWRSSPSSGH